MLWLIGEQQYNVEKTDVKTFRCTSDGVVEEDTVVKKFDTRKHCMHNIIRVMRHIRIKISGKEIRAQRHICFQFK